MASAVRWRQDQRSRSAALVAAALAACVLAGPVQARTGLDVFRQLCLASKPDFASLPGRAAALGATAIADDVHSIFGLLPSPQTHAYWQIDSLDGTRAKLLVGTLGQPIAGAMVRSCFVAGVPTTPPGLLRAAFPTAAIGERRDGLLYDWTRTVVVPDGPDGPLFMLAQGSQGSMGLDGPHDPNTVIALSILSAPLDALPAIARELSTPSGASPAPQTRP